MKYVRGDRLRVKSLDEITKLGLSEINQRTGLPKYADGSMREFFSGSYTVEYLSYEKEGDIGWVRCARPSDPWFDMWFRDVDVEKYEDSAIPVYEEGQRVILKEQDDARCSKQVAVILRALKDIRRSQVSVKNKTGGERMITTINNEDIEGLWYEGYDPPAIRYVVRCSRCGTMFEIVEGDEPCAADNMLCPPCRSRRFITPYHHYRPQLTFYKKGSEDDLFLGVELEVDDGGEIHEHAARVMDIVNENGMFIYCSHDGSLSEGFEIITMPATNAYHHSIRDTYEKMGRELKEMGYHSHNTSTCGIHVHFNRNFFGKNEEEDISKLLYLVEKFWDEIVIFSRRDYRSLDRYAKKPDTPSDEFIDEWNKSDSHDGHYYAVNITNSDTIELRMFRGTLNMDSYMAILDFVDRLARVAKEKTVNEIQSLPFEALLSDSAAKYYKTRCEAIKWED